LHPNIRQGANGAARRQFGREKIFAQFNSAGGQLAKIKRFLNDHCSPVEEAHLLVWLHERLLSGKCIAAFIQLRP